MASEGATEEVVMCRKYLLIMMLCAMAIVLVGCESALLNMRKDSEQREIRIQDKERELHELQEQQSELREKQNRLLSDLKKKQMDQDTLNSRLEELRWDNAQLKALTD